MLKWEFSGFGNFSTNFGWDDGLCSRINSKATPGFNAQMGVECEVYSHGGSRTAYGMVFAPSKARAKELLREFDARYPVVEYNAPCCNCNNAATEDRSGWGFCPACCELIDDPDTWDNDMEWA